MNVLRVSFEFWILEFIWDLVLALHHIRCGAWNLVLTL